jgi:AcrR family transcriptional regulator
MSAPASHRRGEHVRRTVLAAAFDELAGKGVGAATVAGVARRSGVHETTIYRRWVTKEKLFVEAMLSRSAEEIPTPDTGSIRDDLLAVVRAVIAYLTSPVGLAALHVASLAAEDQQDARQAFWAGRLDALRPVVERGIAREELRPDIDAELLLETLIAPLHGRLLLTGEPVDERLGERIVDLVLQGARQAPSSAHFDNQ